MNHVANAQQEITYLVEEIEIKLSRSCRCWIIPGFFLELAVLPAVNWLRTGYWSTEVWVIMLLASFGTIVLLSINQSRLESFLNDEKAKLGRLAGDESDIIERCQAFTQSCCQDVKYVLVSILQQTAALMLAVNSLWLAFGRPEQFVSQMHQARFILGILAVIIVTCQIMQTIATTHGKRYRQHLLEP